MKKILIPIMSICLLLGFTLGASAWMYLPDQGDTGWQTYTYTAGSGGFSGFAGFVVSNVIDNSCYSELLLDNLSQGGAGNSGFESGLSGYEVYPNSAFADTFPWRQSALGTMYEPTQGDYLAYLLALSTGIDTSAFFNATGQAGDVGAIMETAITLAAGETFSFDWAFLGNDFTPWDDFALFYLKDAGGNIVFFEGLAQIGSNPAPIPGSVLLLGSGLLGLLGLTWKRKRQGG